MVNLYEESYCLRFKCRWIVCSRIRVLQFDVDNGFVVQALKTKQGNQGAVFGVEQVVRCISRNIEAPADRAVSRFRRLRQRNFDSYKIIAVDQLHDRHGTIRSHEGDDEF
jgi:hypothetical protein